MWETIKTPAYVVDEKKLRENLECLHRVEEETGCHILLAQKAFSMFRVYPLIGSYLNGTTASCKEYSRRKAYSLLYDIWSELPDSYEVP